MTQEQEYKGPLAGLNVVDFGHYYAGPAAGMILADQGANVVRIVKPGEPELPSEQYRLFNRNKKMLTLDLKTDKGLKEAKALIAKADVVIENFRPGVMARLGLDYATLKVENPGLIYLSLPGFSATDKERASIQAWEGVLGAASGMYRNASIGREGHQFPPVFSFVPQASMYGAYNGTLAIMAALIAREEHKVGTVIEVPLAEAAMLGYGSYAWFVSLSKHIVLPSPREEWLYSPEDSQEDQLAKIANTHKAKWAANPLGNYYKCADGREVFIYAAYPNVAKYSTKLLKVLGIEKQLKQEGFVNAGAWETGIDNNYCYTTGLSKERLARLTEIMKQVFLTKTAQEWEDILGEAGIAATLIRTREEWLALEPMKKSGIFTTMDDGKTPITVPGPIVDVSGPEGTVAEYANEPEVTLYEDALSLFEATSSVEEWKKTNGAPKPVLKKGDLLKNVKVIELTNMLAGPFSGIFLAEFGANVIKADPADCPSPAASARGPLLLQGKRSIVTDVKTAPGREVFERLIKWSDAIVHNVLDDTTERLGISQEQLRKVNPKVVGCQISSYGGPKRCGWEKRPGYDNLAQAVSGLMVRYGSLETPQDHGGISCADTAGGLNLAFTTLLGVYQQRKTGFAGEGRTSLARMANFYQLPYMIADAAGRSEWGEPHGQFTKGPNWHQRMYECEDAWIYVDVPKARAAELVKSVTGRESATETDLEAAFKGQSCDAWFTRLTAADIPCHKVINVGEVFFGNVRNVGNERTDESNPVTTELMAWEDHPYGLPVKLLAPNYVRIGEDRSWLRLGAAPRFGENTTEILSELGYDDDEIQELIRLRVAHEFLPQFGSKDVYYFEPERK